MKRRLALLALLPALALGQGNSQPRIALIMDDLGYNSSRGRAVLELPAAITCAVIPRAPQSPRLAREAIAAGKEVMLHLPMANEGDAPLGKGGLRKGMSARQIRTRVRAALERIPQAVGANNHMGSITTTRDAIMRPVMRELAQQQRYFIDSLTTPKSVAAKMARRVQVPTASRDVFLDNQRDLLRINEQFNKLIAQARRQGQAIGIGHPYPETITYLKKVLPLLPEMGIELVPVSRLITTRKPGEPRKLANKP